MSDGNKLYAEIMAFDIRAKRSAILSAAREAAILLVATDAENIKLRSQIAAKNNVLARAGVQFAHYAEGHKAKADALNEIKDEGAGASYKKADVNREMSELCAGAVKA